MEKWNDYIDRLIRLKQYDSKTYMQYGTSMFINGIGIGAIAAAMFFFWFII